MRLGDLDALRDNIEHLYSIYAENKDWFYTDVLNHIDNAPTVEQEVYMTGEDYDLYMKGYNQARKDLERPQGEWVATKYYTWECSKCGKSPTIGMGYVQNHTELFNFCPNCGASMMTGGEKE